MSEGLYEKYFKRVFDFAFAVILLLLTAPILIICVTAIKLESKGPILF